MMTQTEHAKSMAGPAPIGAASYVAVDPLQRPGWDSQVEAYAQASVFHGTGWARVLRQTYGHTPVYICRFDGDKIVDLLPIMEVKSPLTGRRGISLPFTDFCPPLKANGNDGAGLYQAAMDEGRRRGWKYLECRSWNDGWAEASPSLAFYGHIIDLTGGEQAMLKRMESSIARGIRKAVAADLQTDFSTSLEAMKEYYALHCRTRRRHGLPPQPFEFFGNIQAHVLDKGRGFIATVRLKQQPVAGGIFLHQGRTALYKFGASNFDFQQLRPNNLMMWAGIKQCAKLGCTALHLGRTSIGNSGLRRFKLSFGASEETVQYCKYDFLSGGFVVDADRTEGWFNSVFGRLPLPLLRLAGRVLYPHLS